MNLLLNVMISLLIGLFYLMQQQNAAVQGFVNLADVECGVPSVNVNRRYRRTVDGDDATEGEFPWMVSIRIRVSSSHICGGSLIHKNWVLTAAHCVDYLKLSEIEVVVGQLNLIVKGHSSKVWKRRIQQVVLHPSYVTSSNTVSTGDDIALVRLKPIRSNWNNQLVRPICLSDDRRLTSNKKRLPFSTMVMMATVTGWGRSDVSEINTSSNISRIKALQKVDLPIVSNEQCQLWYRREDWSMKIKASHLCAGFESGGKDSCLEDSGGPLMIKQNGRFVIVGIVSAGIGCGLPRTPGIYTRVSSYIDWIKSVLTKNQ